MIALLLVVTMFAGGEDSLAAARELYASAAYEDALAVLAKLPESNLPDEARVVEQYRALCLLALGRTGEAERAIEAVVNGDPAYRPATDVSPRVRTAFSDVRKRMLPAIIQQKYTRAKASFDRKEFATAATEFTQMLESMVDPDLQTAGAQPPLSDLRTLASGFRDLAVNAAAPPPPPPPPPVLVPEPLPPQMVPQQAPRASYSSADPNVIAPVTIRQDLPPFPGQILVGRTGMIEVLIDESGAVESAIVRQPVSSQYDNLALAATKAWRYRPATLNGAPVKFRKVVQITVKPDRR
jgi:TonB family protein